MTAEIDETAAKARFWTSATVDARLHATFANGELRRAALLLSALVGEDPADADGSDEASCRLMLAALKVSGGSLTKLAMWVEVAHADPRDLLVAAEYPRELQGGGEDAREKDLAAYLSWISGSHEVR